MMADLGWTWPLVAGLIAFAVSALATWVVRSVCRAKGWLAPVRKDRWHRKPVALHGGVAMYVGFLVAYLVVRPASIRGDALLVVSASAMFLLGMADDVLDLKPYVKLVAQFVAAASLTLFGLRLHWLSNQVLDVVVTLLWLVGIANALNLLDNMDGLAAGIAVIAAGFSAYVFASGGGLGQAAMAMALGGAAAGFLLFNVHPASIFMGDSGSLFLGFSLAGLALLDLPVEAHSSLGVLAVPVLILLIPIMDTTLVTLTRSLAQRPVSQGGRDHTSHRLVALGLSQRAATVLLWTLAVLSGLLGLVVRRFSWPVAMTLLLLFGLTVVLLAVFVGKVRVYDAPGSDGEFEARERSGAGAESGSGGVSFARAALGGSAEGSSGLRPAVLPTLAGFLYRRHLFEVLGDLVIIVAAYFGSFLLRWDGALIQPHYALLVDALPVVVAIQLVSFLAVGLYRGMWRYTTLDDLASFVKAVAAAWSGTVVYLLIRYRFQGFSRTMFLLDAILLFGLLVGSRLSFRLIGTWLEPVRRQAGRRAIVYGAGDAGALLVRETRANEGWRLSVVGFIDDDPDKQHRTIQGRSVLGTFEDLDRIVKRTGATVIVLSTDRLSRERLGQVEQASQTLGLELLQLTLRIVHLTGPDDRRESDDRQARIAQDEPVGNDESAGRAERLGQADHTQGAGESSADADSHPT